MKALTEKPAEAKRFRHGHASRGKVSPTFLSWASMIQRCTNPKDRCFADYGGRGITICPRWHVFANFLADMGERPEGMTLDRKESSGNYSPENCRWATRKEQNNNTSRNHFVEFNGQKKTLAQWALITGISQTAIRLRLRNGKTIQQALTP